MTAAANRSAALRELVAHQHGLATRAQLRRLGVESYMVKSQVEGGRWQALSRRVIALQTGAINEAQVSWFAILDGGEECVLDGLSALHGYGLQGFPAERVQTAVPLSARSVRNELYVQRRSHRLTQEAVHPVRQPPTMRVGPALLSALEHNTLPLRGCALLAAVVQQRLIRACELRPLLVATTTLPHRGLYLATAGDIEGGAHSLLEIDFSRLARQAGIPAPRCQTVRPDRRGRRRYLDADFDGFGVEVDGAIHLRPLAWWDDMLRLNDIVIRDKPMLRFPSVGIRLKRAEVIEQLRQAAARWL